MITSRTWAILCFITAAAMSANTAQAYGSFSVNLNRLSYNDFSFSNFRSYEASDSVMLSPAEINISNLLVGSLPAVPMQLPTPFSNPVKASVSMPAMIQINQNVGQQANNIIPAAAITPAALNKQLSGFGLLNNHLQDGPIMVQEAVQVSTPGHAAMLLAGLLGLFARRFRAAAARTS